MSKQTPALTGRLRLPGATSDLITRAGPGAIGLRGKGATVLMCAVLAGCGYRMQGGQNPELSPGYAFDADATTEPADNAAVPAGYQWKSLYREDIQTVAVPVFVNRTFRRGVESKLTQSIIQQMEEHTPYKVVPRDRADTVLEGDDRSDPDLHAGQQRIDGAASGAELHGQCQLFMEKPSDRKKYSCPGRASISGRAFSPRWASRRKSGHRTRSTDWR